MYFYGSPFVRIAHPLYVLRLRVSLSENRGRIFFDFGMKKNG